MLTKEGRDLMNEVFLIGKVIEDIEYKFMIKKRKNAKAKIVMLQLMWNKKYSKKVIQVV